MVSEPRIIDDRGAYQSAAAGNEYFHPLEIAIDDVRALAYSLRHQIQVNFFRYILAAARGRKVVI